MSLLDTLLAAIAPHDCLGCGAEGRLLCGRCTVDMPPALAQCYRCYAPSAGGLTCSDCAAASSLTALRSAVIYQGLAKKLIWRIKASGAQAAAAVMAARMAPLLERHERTVLVSVPTATSRVRQRGYDQTRLIARQLARQAGLPWLDCLRRSGQAHQVGAGRQQRRQQLQTAFRVSQQRFVRGAHIMLVDDVVTTGATLEAAAHVLLEAGATRIEAVTFAQTKKPTGR